MKAKFSTVLKADESISGSFNQSPEGAGPSVHAGPVRPSAIAPGVVARRSSLTVQKLLRYTLPSLAVVGGLSALDLLRARYQRSQVFLPTRYPIGEWDPLRHALLYQDVWFKSEDGVELHGWWIEHPHARMTVVYCHGNTGCIADRIEILQQMRRLRVNVFAFDYRGYGRSAGTPGEKGLFADVRAACDWVRDVAGIGLDRVILFGHSLGGAVAIDGALHRPVAGLVVQSSFTQLRDMARACYRNLPMHLIARNEFRSIDKVAHLSMPKMFVHGMDDETVPFAMGEQLHAAAGHPKHWYPVAGAGHNDVPQRGRVGYLLTLRRFSQACLLQKAVGNA